MGGGVRALNGRHAVFVLTFVLLTLCSSALVFADAPAAALFTFSGCTGVRRCSRRRTLYIGSGCTDACASRCRSCCNSRRRILCNSCGGACEHRCDRCFGVGSRRPEVWRLQRSCSHLCRPSWEAPPLLFRVPSCATAVAGGVRAPSCPARGSGAMFRRRLSAADGSGSAPPPPISSHFVIGSAMGSAGLGQDLAKTGDSSPA